MEKKTTFKTTAEFKHYAAQALKEIADLCDQYGISFWHGEEGEFDELRVQVGDRSMSFEEIDGISATETAVWLRAQAVKFDDGRLLDGECPNCGSLSTVYDENDDGSGAVLATCQVCGTVFMEHYKREHVSTYPLTEVSVKAYRERAARKGSTYETQI